MRIDRYYHPTSDERSETVGESNSYPNDGNLQDGILIRELGDGNNNLSSLTLDRGHFGPDGGDAIAQALLIQQQNKKKKSCLESLLFHRCKFEPGFLSRMLKAGQLISLCFAECDLSTSDIEELSGAAAKGRICKELSLCGETIHDSLVLSTAFADASCVLETLCLEECDFGGEEGLIGFIERGLGSIVGLELRRMRVAPRLLDTLSTCHPLTSLSIEDCNLDYPSVVKHVVPHLSRLLLKSQTIQSLTLQNDVFNVILPDLGEAVRDGLKCNTSLQNLRMSAIRYFPQLQAEIRLLVNSNIKLDEFRKQQQDEETKPIPTSALPDLFAWQRPAILFPMLQMVDMNELVARVQQRRRRKRTIHNISTF